MTIEMRTGVAAGVPFVAVPPSDGRPTAPVVVAWHLLDAPCTEPALAAALPMAGLDAWRVYLGLPMTGSRLPAGGFEELMRRGYEDAVLRLHGPIITRAAQEFPAALAAIGAELGLRPSALGLVGGSAGAGVAQLVLAEQTGHLPAPVHAAVLVSPVVRLRAVVAAGSRRFGTSYAWSPAATEVADRLDFVARVDDVAAGQPAIRLVVGAEDDEEGFGEPAAQLRTALADRYDDPARVDLATVTGMAHAFAEEPGTDPAPQTPAAVAVDRLAEQWLGQHLPAEERDRDRAGVVW